MHHSWTWTCLLRHAARCCAHRRKAMGSGLSCCFDLHDSAMEPATGKTRAGFIVGAVSAPRIRRIAQLPVGKPPGLPLGQSGLCGGRKPGRDGTPAMAPRLEVRVPRQHVCRHQDRAATRWAVAAGVIGWPRSGLDVQGIRSQPIADATHPFGPVPLRRHRRPAPARVAKPAIRPSGRFERARSHGVMQDCPPPTLNRGRER